MPSDGSSSTRHTVSSPEPRRVNSRAVPGNPVAGATPAIEGTSCGERVGEAAAGVASTRSEVATPAGKELSAGREDMPAKTTAAPVKNPAVTSATRVNTVEK